MKRIAVFTSGGDAPGMNACIRAVVRAAVYNQIEVYGIYHGFQGMINGEFKELDSCDVSGIIQHGGTILKSSRSEEFMTKKGREKAFENLKENGIEGVVAIGGDGTFTGASVFSQEFGIPFIGIPGTIDNDLFGTDYTIGYDTAINTVVQAVDKLRDTASSHDRLFFVEVMGRDAGFIALRSGIGVGAEAVLVPETKTYLDQLIKMLEKGWKREKESMIIIVAEGDDEGGAAQIAAKVKKKFDHYDTRITVLGHIQRGGSPTAMERVLASRLGVASVEALLKGRENEMAGIVNNKLLFTPFERAVKHNTELNSELLKLTEILSV